MTLHDLIDNLTESLNLTPEQQFRVTAQIKRLIHSEKASVFQRYAMYGQGVPIFKGEGENAKVVGHQSPDDPWLHNLLKQKAEQHREMAEKFTDEQLVTWSVGSHKFRQTLSPCSECLADVSSAGGYVTSYEEGKTTTFCKPCAIKNNAWPEEDLDETT